MAKVCLLGEGIQICYNIVEFSHSRNIEAIVSVSGHLLGKFGSAPV